MHRTAKRERDAAAGVTNLLPAATVGPRPDPAVAVQAGDDDATGAVLAELQNIIQAEPVFVEDAGVGNRTLPRPHRGSNLWLSAHRRSFADRVTRSISPSPCLDVGSPCQGGVVL